MKKFLIGLCVAGIIAISCALAVINGALPNFLERKEPPAAAAAQTTATPSAAQKNQAPNPSGETTKSAATPRLNMVSADESLIKPPWTAADLGAAPGCIFYYNNQDSPGGFILLQRTQTDTNPDLEKQLKISFKKYSDALAGTDVKLSRPVYGETGGMPAVWFESTNDNGTVKSKTVLTAVEGALYCLQMQDDTQSFDKNTDMFNKLAESLKLNGE